MNDIVGNVCLAMEMYFSSALSEIRYHLLSGLLFLALAASSECGGTVPSAAPLVSKHLRHVGTFPVKPDSSGKRRSVRCHAHKLCRS